MKFKTPIYILILVLVTLIGTWGIPYITRKMTYTPDNYPFVYYSSILKELCYVDFKNKETPMTDSSGNKYTTAEYDSLLPLFNFRQLANDGRLPDSIDGHEITRQLLMSKWINYRFTPTKFRTPETKLYLMYESMPKRVGLELPPDVFRMTDKIEFITDESNTVNEQKSRTFQQALDKAGYSFPPQWVRGNLNPRKPYDDGYFSLDNNNRLFHIKMVNGRPFVRDTRISESMDIEEFTMLEVSDKRFYGFLFDKTGNMYIIESDEGQYKPLKLDIPPVDIRNEEVLVMGNIFYWTVTVLKKESRDYYALHTETLERIQQSHIDRTLGKWDQVSEWLFPVYLTFEHNHSHYIYPKITFTGYKAFIINFVLGLLVAFAVPNPRKKKIFQFIFILLTGWAGLIGLLVLPDFTTKNYKVK